MYTNILQSRTPPVNTGNVRQLFDHTEAAPALSDTVPKGEYVAHWIGIKQDHASTGTPRVVLAFEIIDGEFLGKRLWQDLYLTPAAVARSKRELAKLDVTTADDFVRPIPHWIRCSLRVIVEIGNDGKPRNKIADFGVLSVDHEQPDPFAPQADGGASTTHHSPLGFRVVGSPYKSRDLITWATAFEAYAQCDERANVHKEAYLSAFQFPEEFRIHMEANKSTKGYTGSCWSRFLWFDIDREDDPHAALRDARQLVDFLKVRYAIDDELLIWFSGGKGYHVGLPTSLWLPEASPLFGRICRKMAETLAGQCGIVIDSSVYDSVRLFRAPNSRHPKTGLFKRLFTHDELFTLDVHGIQSDAEEPLPFGIPADPPVDEQAVADWLVACETATATAVVRPAEMPPDRLNRSTREFLQRGADVGGRHRLLYSAARNLGEFGCSLELAIALLQPAACESGLSPSDIRRQIECGLDDQDQKGGAR